MANTSAEIISKIYLAKYKEKDLLFSRKDKRMIESRARKEKTPFDYTKSWDTIINPNQMLTMIDVRKLFSASGLDYELAVPLQIR